MGMQGGKSGWESRFRFQFGSPGAELRVKIQDGSPGCNLTMGIQGVKSVWEGRMKFHVLSGLTETLLRDVSINIQIMQSLKKYKLLTPRALQAGWADP